MRAQRGAKLSAPATSKNAEARQDHDAGAAVTCHVICGLPGEQWHGVCFSATSPTARLQLRDEMRSAVFRQPGLSLNQLLASLVRLQDPLPAARFPASAHRNQPVSCDRLPDLTLILRWDRGERQSIVTSPLVPRVGLAFFSQHFSLCGPLICIGPVPRVGPALLL